MDGEEQMRLRASNGVRKIGLLTRKMNAWKAVEELPYNLREFDTADPVKYDYALFGPGISKDIF
jgi:hypothetical protein